MRPPIPSASESTGSSLADNRVHFLNTLKCANRQLDWITFDLDPLIADDAEVVEQFLRIARVHETSRIRVLIVRPESLRQHKHRLVPWIQRLDSKIAVRTATEQQQRESVCSFLVTDQGSWYRRPIATQWEFESGIGDARARFLRAEFEELWQHASQYHPFRRLDI